MDIEQLIQAERVRYAILGMAYKAKEPVCYKEVAEVMGMPTRGHSLARTLGPILGTLVKYDCEKGLPLTSALVVNKATGIPGPGFFIALHNAGMTFNDASDSEKLAVWQIALTDFPFLRSNEEAEA